MLWKHWDANHFVHWHAGSTLLEIEEAAAVAATSGLTTMTRKSDPGLNCQSLVATFLPARNTRHGRDL